MDKPDQISSDNTLPGLDDSLRVNPDVYNSIAKCAKLVGIQLIESNFTISPAFFEKQGKTTPNVEVVNIHEAFDSSTKVATSIFQLEVFFRQSRKKIFQQKDKFVVFYLIDDECDEHHALAFARRTGLIAIYPYFRAHLAQNAALANAKVPVLPTIASMPVKSKPIEPEETADE